MDRVDVVRDEINVFPLSCSGSASGPSTHCSSSNRAEGYAKLLRAGSRSGRSGE